MSIAAIWTILRALPWKWIGLALTAAAIAYAAYSWAYGRGFHARDAEVAGLGQSIANLKAASAAATAQNLAHVRAVEAQGAQIQKEQSDAFDHQLADARTVAAAYIRLHPAIQTGIGNAGAGSLPQATPAAGATASAAQATVVPVSDIEACTDAFVIAEGWQDWWSKVSVAQPEG